MRNNLVKNKITAVLLFVFFLLTNISDSPVLVSYAAEANIVKIGSAADLVSFAEKSRSGEFDSNVYVEITNNIDMSEVDAFNGISTFSGHLNGNSHTISGVEISNGSEAIGLFGYVEAGALVENLNVIANISSTSSSNYVGIVAGVNAGTLRNCTVSGAVNGTGVTGGVCGLNGSEGTILKCRNKAKVDSIDSVGGICGENRGTIAECSNYGEINSDDAWLYYDDNAVNSFSLEGLLGMISTTVDVGKNIGGIAGYSSGIISNSKNTGIVGYQHAGKNVGGIVGRLNGKINSCSNKGKVYGKQDVGGIVGQFEPSLLPDGKQSIYSAMNELNDLSKSLANDMEAAGNAASKEFDKASDNLEDLSNKVGDKVDENKDENGNLKLDKDTIDNAQNKFDKNTIEDAQNKIDSYNINVDKIKDSVSVSANELSNYENTEFYSELSNQLDSLSSQLSGIGNEVEHYTETISDDVNKINDKMADINALANEKIDNLKQISKGQSVIEDYSAVDSENPDANRISSCSNEGYVNGDRNVGGIIGNVGVEGTDEEDSEHDENAHTYVTIAVIESCNDYGILEVRKCNAGGIVGNLALGLIRDCSAFGRLVGDKANFIGGIAGYAEGTIDSCNSVAVINGLNYIGGVAGIGEKIRHCNSMASIIEYTDYCGSILGAINNSSESDITIAHKNMMLNVYDNYFVSDLLFGINGVNYKKVAEAISYDQLRDLDNAKYDFDEFKVSFVNTSKEVIKTLKYNYNNSLDNLEYPVLSSEEGEYITWDGQVCDKVCGNVFLMAKEADEVYVLKSDLEIGDKSAVLISDIFYDNSEFEVKESGRKDFPNATNPNCKTLSYSIDIKNVIIKDDEEIKIRFYVGNEEKIKVYRLDNDSWRELDFVKYGRYIETSLLGNSGCFAIVADNTKPNYVPYICGGIILFIIFIIFIIIKNNKKKSLKYKEQIAPLIEE